MEKIAFLGKGGIGKSTILANLSLLYAWQGRRVFHVGCDPKHDSSLLLTRRHDVPTVVDQLIDTGRIDAEAVIVSGPEGIDFIEAGGPEPGVGCAGRGIAKMLEFFKTTGMLEQRRYEIVLFDLLGDIVCGGFATPLRRGFAEKVFIVVSDDLMSLYAANNICRAVVNCAASGAVLGGLVANRIDSDTNQAPIEGLARLLNTQVVTVLPRDPAFREAAYARQTLVEHDPGSDTVLRLEALSRTILALEPGQRPLPTPLADPEFYELARQGFAG